jgi:membrane glycosyltransferase
MDALKLTDAAAHRERWLRHQALWRRALFFGLTFASSLIGSFLLLDILKANGISVLEVASLVMFFVLFTWISGAFWTAVAGFFARLIGRDPALLQPDQVASHVLQGRTAIVIPIYNEDAARVFSGVEAIWGSLQQQPEAQARSFDFFILSDTRKADIAQQEEAAWRELVETAPASERLFYRRRTDNVGRKAGNIAEFVAQLGRQLRLHAGAGCGQHHVRTGAWYPSPSSWKRIRMSAWCRRCRC